MAKSHLLNKLAIKSPCSADWDAMNGNDQVRFCGHCELSVRDLSQMTRTGAMRLVLQSKGRLCLRIQRDAAGAVVTRPIGQKLHTISRRASRIAAGAFTAVMSVSGAAYAQSSGLPVPGQERPVAERALKLRAAGTSAWLVGTVTDVNGAVIPEARVTVTNKKTNEVQITQVGDDGQYRFWLSGDYTYTVFIEAKGFASFTLDAVEIELANETRKDATLEYANGNFVVGDVAIAPYQKPLVVAASKDDLNAIDRLLLDGENVNQAEEDGVTALDLAVARAEFEIARRLIGAGASVDVGGRNGDTPVFWLTGESGVKMLALLLDAGANVNRVNNEGDTALMQASGYESAELIQALITAGAQVNAQNQQGETALMQAARSGNSDAVRLLLVAGANFSMRNLEGQDALQLAQSNNSDRVIAQLVAAGADPIDEPPAKEK